MISTIAGFAPSRNKFIAFQRLKYKAKWWTNVKDNAV
jgi:hypothetical protein